MTAKFTQADLERARRFALKTKDGYEESLAAEFADVREECAAKCDAYAHPTDGAANPGGRMTARALARAIRSGKR